MLPFFLLEIIVQQILTVRRIGTAFAGLIGAASLAACSGGAGSSSAPTVPQSFQRQQPAAAQAVAVDAAVANGFSPDTCAPPPDPATTSIRLTGQVQNVTLPCFRDFRTTATIPANNSTSSNPITAAVALSTDKTLGSRPNSANGKPISYVSLSPNKTINFRPSTASIVSRVTSPSQIIAGHTYPFEVQVVEFGDAVIQKGTATLNASTHTVTLGIKPPGGTFNGGLHAVVILYRK